MDINIKKILIVEDDAIIAKNLSQAVRRIGFEPVALISKGRGVVDAVKTYKPDLVLMDIQLDDDIDGITAAGNLRTISDIPVIFITSNIQPELVDKALRENPYGYIIKPFRETEIKYAIMLTDQRIAGDREMKRNQNELKELKDFYNTVLNSMTAWVIVVNNKSEIIYYNEPFITIFGDISSASQFRSFINEEFSGRSGLLKKFFKSGERYLKIASIMNSEGDIRKFNVSVSPVSYKDGSMDLAVLSGRDISEIIAQSETLISTREILDNILQTVPTGVLLTDSKGVITLANKTFESMSGFASAELEGKDIKFLQIQSSSDILLLNENTGNGNYIPVEIDLKKKDLDSFPAKVLILNFEKPINENYKMIYFITDISFEKKLEKKQVRLQNHIESIVREMDDLSELLLETNVYNQSIKRGDIEFDIMDRGILKYIESGMTNKQIAGRLEVAEITVKKRLSGIYSKLGINNKYQLIEYLHNNFVPDK
ncbi:MAG: hypothetical protein CVV49_14565 [Spirochaetae bacterium HGW-Spirochaetae-5]|nr:MAG: hypothetical protein CVV49_14565 [Spirochaetae bacterium HGW-Spirochaetae-5]